MLKPMFRYWQLALLLPLWFCPILRQICYALYKFWSSWKIDSIASKSIKCITYVTCIFLNFTTRFGFGFHCFQKKIIVNYVFSGYIAIEKFSFNVCVLHPTWIKCFPSLLSLANSLFLKELLLATKNQWPLLHHPLHAYYYLRVDEPLFC